MNKNEEREIFNKKMPASESIPPTQHWGKMAFTCKTLEAAEARFKEISDKIEERKILKP